MLQLDATPIPSVEGRPAITRGVALNAVTVAMYDDTAVDKAVRRPQIRPARRRCWPAADRNDSTSGTTVTARGASWRRSRRSGAWTPSNGLRSTGRCQCDDVQRGGATVRPSHNRRLLLHVLSDVDRSASRDHRCRCWTGPGLRADWWYASTAATRLRPMAEMLEDSHLIVVDRPAHGRRGVLAVRRRPRRRLPRRPRAACRHGDRLHNGIADQQRSVRLCRDARTSLRHPRREAARSPTCTRSNHGRRRRVMVRRRVTEVAHRNLASTSALASL